MTLIHLCARCIYLATSITVMDEMDEVEVEAVSKGTVIEIL
jgi:hypothetical protein